MAVTFDLFGTLLAVERPAEPARAIAAQLDRRGVTVPADWPAAYREHHVDAPAGAAVALPVHVAAALASRGVTPPKPVLRRSVAAAFEPAVTTRPGASRSIEAAADRGPVGVLSNCAVPGLASRALEHSTIDPAAFDAVVTSVDCGWRKPDARAFESVAGRLSIDPGERFVHVGDDARADGGVEDARPRGVFLHVEDVPLQTLPEHLEVVCP